MVEIIEPGFKRLVGKAVDKVDAEIGETSGGSILQCLLGLTRIVPTIKKAEVGIVERLHPDADAVEEVQLAKV